MLWVGVDVGGTFTDAVLFDDETQSISYAKAPSTPGDPKDGVLDVIERMGIDMGRVERFVHGITIGTNAILEAKGAEVWMLVTEGFKDVLEIARTNRPILYNIKSLKTPPLVPRTRTVEVAERLMYDGSVRKPLAAKSLQAALKQLPKAAKGKTGGATKALCICFLHSYADPKHEEMARKAAEKALPGWFICTSSEVLGQFREYERFNTTALNAYIGPLMEKYLTGLQQGLAKRGYKRDVFIMTSAGGVSTAQRAKRLPITTVLSGPAGGVAAAVHIGKLVGIENLITCDMGGTSTDVCLIEKLNPPVTNEQVIADYANRTPQIAINAVGAGGGSIAWIDRGDILKVGPQSAGANPGPACYGKGGIEPTVTDANLVLGRLDPKNRLAGRIALDVGLARKAVHAMASRLPGLDDFKAADGILRIAVARMVSAIKQISISNGYDPRDFTLLAFGGAGPMHATAIADELEMRRVLVPLGPGNFCAFGSLISDIRRDHVLTRTLQLRASRWADIDATFKGIEDGARKALAEEGVPPKTIETRRALGMRYLGQSWELPVDVAPGTASIEALDAAFAEVHDRRFGHKAADATEVVSFRVAAIGKVSKPVLKPWRVKGTLADARHGERQVYFDGAFMPTAVYDRDKLPAGAMIAGPAIVEESGATTVVPPGWLGKVLDLGDILLERSKS
ncbi:MAG: hydantoinase/oxoprolinase family protein [Alphaproteobacteria bacterium]|nr:hydantoinase/oxoprolinase family protein [Alphaproteobacteria bacterium]